MSLPKQCNLARKKERQIDKLSFSLSNHLEQKYSGITLNYIQSFKKYYFIICQLCHVFSPSLISFSHTQFTESLEKSSCTSPCFSFLVPRDALVLLPDKSCSCAADGQRAVGLFSGIHCLLAYQSLTHMFCYQRLSASCCCGFPLGHTITTHSGRITGCNQSTRPVYAPQMSVHRNKCKGLKMFFKTIFNSNIIINPSKDVQKKARDIMAKVQWHCSKRNSFEL